MDEIIIIGKREKAVLGVSTYIFYFFLSVILFFFSILFFTFIFIGKSNGLYIFGFLLGVFSFIGLGVIFLLLGLDKIKVVKNNNMNEKDCLIYDKNENKFVFYDVKNNDEIKIEKDKLVKIIGSKLKTNNELFIFYKDNNRIKKISAGYCYNIEHESFNLELSKIIDPKDVGL